MNTDLAAITTRLESALMTDHGQILCGCCWTRNKRQLIAAGVNTIPVQCSAIVECTLCGGSATAL